MSLPPDRAACANRATMAHRRELLVWQDTREKRPFLFPRVLLVEGTARLVRVVKHRMDYGDYALVDRAHVCAIERKGSMREIATNLCDPRDAARQVRAFQRLAACRVPILVVESTPCDLLRPTAELPAPGDVITRLFLAAHRYGLRVWFVGSCGQPSRRRAVGELILRAMLAAEVTDGVDVDAAFVYNEANETPPSAPSETARLPTGR